MLGPMYGITRRVTATGASSGAGATTISLRPDKGCVWELLMIYGYQDDGAVSQSWLWADPEGGSSNLLSITGAANVHWHLGTEDDTATSTQLLRGPVHATYDRYPRFQFTASGAGKNGTIVALVREYKGIAVEA